MAKYRWGLAGKLYHTAEKAVIGTALRKNQDSREHYNLKLVFDYVLFNTLLVLPEIFYSLYYQNTIQLLIYPFFVAISLLCMWMLKRRVSARWAGTLAALNVMVISMLSSFLNNQDISLMYAMTWILGILFCYLTTNLATTLVLSSLLCGYLVLTAYIKSQGIVLFSAAGYSALNVFDVAPVFTAFTILFIVIRVLGRHYNNIMIVEGRRTLQRQRQHSALIRQNLTKQFMLVKGLSRSGKTKYLEGNLELLEACLTEIEKQCETAIDLLQDGQKVAGEPHKKSSPVD
ncbi:hypothetical protein [uncultured Chitinophaga sp.]|jgi:hypothetical protein|uniref:hypothetical protein n=1 Tax=uncultured Chitinophaga sp. TaxID=339340 RepID=UPI0026380171|nr:hypothetical protein [uncultured Chitinophaga sp.]